MMLDVAYARRTTVHWSLWSHTHLYYTVRSLPPVHLNTIWRDYAQEATGAVHLRGRLQISHSDKVLPLLVIFLHSSTWLDFEHGPDPVLCNNLYLYFFANNNSDARRVWQLIQCCPTGPVRSIRSSIKSRLLRCLSPSFISFLFLESRGKLIILSLSLVVPRIYHTNNLTTRIFKLTVHCYLLSRS